MAELSSEELEKIVKEEDNSIKPMKESRKIISGIDRQCP